MNGLPGVEIVVEGKTPDGVSKNGTNPGWKLSISPGDVGLGTNPSSDFETVLKQLCGMTLPGNCSPGSALRDCIRQASAMGQSCHAMGTKIGI